MNSDFEVTILGASAAMPSKNAWLSGHYVRARNLHILIDCGEGTQFQLLRCEISPLKLTHIFITHLHGDHYFGLIGLLSSMCLQKREQPLHLFAPSGLDEMITLHARHSHIIFPFPIHFHSLPDSPSVLWEDEEWSVQNFSLNHRIFCQGFLIQEKPPKRKILRHKLPANLPFHLFPLLQDGKDVEFNETLYKNEDVTTISYYPRSYAYCSDTAYYEEILPFIENVDLLYHETTFLAKDTETALSTYHSTSVQAATIAQKANAKGLIIGHFSTRYKDLNVFLEEAKAIFPNTHLAESGKVFGIEKKADL
ncbi:MAG: ribonuclease Z [Flammeovirgaceae bacterium]